MPVLGNVYVLGRRAAERMAGGSPPGCWASPELVERVRRESEGPDGGLDARLERAAQTVAVLKGLGYAGAYIGGTHDAGQLVRIIARARELEPHWQDVRGRASVRPGRRFLSVRLTGTRAAAAAGRVARTGQRREADAGHAGHLAPAAAACRCPHGSIDGRCWPS